MLLHPASLFRGIGGEIDTLSRYTESTFLSVGAGLQELSRRTEKMAALETTASGMMAGPDLMDSITGLQRIVGRLEQFREASAARIVILNGILEKFEGLRRALGGYERIMKSLSILVISIRVEDARLDSGDIGFDALANEVRHLSLEIQNTTGRIIDRSAVLSIMVNRTLTRAAAMERTQQIRASGIIDHFLSRLDRLLEKHRLSAQEASQLSNRYEEISKRIEEVCALQIAQLQHASGRLTEAMEGVVGSLGAVLAGAKEIARRVQDLAESAEPGKQTFLEEIERELDPLTGLLSEYGKAGQDLSEALKTVAATMSDLDGFAGDIEYIGIQIERIAVNACIKASQLGQKGDALGVLAEVLQRFAIETREKTGAITDLFRSISAAVGRLIEGSSARDLEGVNADCLGTDLFCLMDILKKVDQEIRSMVDRINGETHMLSEEIGTALEAVRIKGDVAGRIERMIADFREAAGAFTQKAGFARRSGCTPERSASCLWREGMKP